MRPRRKPVDRDERNQRVFELGEALDKANGALLEINALGHLVSGKTANGLSEAISKWQQREGPPDKKMEKVDRRDLRVGLKLRRRAIRYLHDIKRDMTQATEVLDDAIDEFGEQYEAVRARRFRR